LLLERGHYLVFVQTEYVRVLPDKTAREKATRKAIELILFHRL
jgi:hypothetical protein